MYKLLVDIDIALKLVRIPFVEKKYIFVVQIYVYNYIVSLIMIKLRI